MAFPKTVKELDEQGYIFLDVRPCEAKDRCGALVMWYRTPAGKRMPMDQHNRREPGAEVVTHFATCPAARQFHQASKKKAADTKNAPADPMLWDGLGPNWDDPKGKV